MALVGKLEDLQLAELFHLLSLPFPSWLTV